MRAIVVSFAALLLSIIAIVGKAEASEVSVYLFWQEGCPHCARAKAVLAEIDTETAALLVKIGDRTRNLKGHGLDEGASTRMLIQAGRLMAGGVRLERACAMTIVLPITDDPDLRDAMSEIIAACA